MQQTIRFAEITDIDQLSGLFDAYRVFYHKESDLPAAKTFLTDRITRQESVIFVSEKNNTLSGFVQLYPLFSSTRMKRLWLLNDLYIDPNYRGHGISKLLIVKAQQYAIISESAGLILETHKDNIIGNALYPKVDFTLEDECNYYYWNT